jgi:hypothetical protein
MEEIKVFDQLLEYPKKYNLEYWTNRSEKHFHVVPSGEILNREFVIIKKDDLFFCANDSYGSRTGNSRVYSGLYTTIDLPDTTEVSITKADWTDRLFRVNKRKSENSYVNNHLTITSPSKDVPGGLISHAAVGYFLKITEMTYPINLVIEKDFNRLVRDLKGKVVIALEARKWISEEQEINHLLMYGDLLFNEIRNSI